MSHTQAAGDGAAAPADAPSPHMLVNGQYLKDLSFESPNSPSSLAEMSGDTAPNVDVNVDVNAAHLKEDLYEVVLSIRAEAKQGERIIFIAELHYGGLFTITNAGDMLQALLLVEAPRLLFPYARAIVSESVRDGGFPPLLIHPIDFVGLLRQRLAAEAQAAASGAGAAEAAAEAPTEA